MHKQRIATGMLAALIAMIVSAPTLGRGRQTQAEMNRDAAREYAQADAALNKAYRQLYATLDKNRKARLKKAQLAWLKFRDAEGEFASSEAEGGSMQPMVRSNALARLTQQRTRELQEYHTQIKSR